MKKFRKKDREKIVSDWRTCLPAMRVDRSMSLMKRNGPIITGIYLQEDRGNTSYKVVPYVHNLSIPKAAVTLTISYELRNRRNTYHDSFTAESHTAEFSGACKRLHEQTLFPLTEGLSVSEITAAYETYIDRALNVDYPTNLYFDVVSYFAWCGDLAEAERRRRIYQGNMADWDDKIFRHHGGSRHAAFQRLTELVENHSGLATTVESQLDALGLRAIPDYGLRCV